MIKENIERLSAELPSGCRLVAVSKLKPVDDIRQAYDAGQRVFGENYATEMRDKHALLPADIEWHFIGHLQSNKIKYIAPFVSMIHGIDSPDLLRAVDAAARKNGRVIDCLLQFHIAQEETKFGFAEDELTFLDDLPQLTGVRICGVMGMASHTEDTEQVRAEFHHLNQIFKNLKAGHFASHPEFCELSMGMSHDYRIAVSEGSTMVRIGTGVFGPRDYSKKINL